MDGFNETMGLSVRNASGALVKAADNADITGWVCNSPLRVVVVRCAFAN
jgi:hypothetical protein